MDGITTGYVQTAESVPGGTSTLTVASTDAGNSGNNTANAANAPTADESANEPTQAEIDAAREIKRLKDALSKSNSENAEWKRKIRAQMTEDERRREEEAEQKAELERNYKELLHKTTIAEHSKKLLGLGLDEVLASDMAEALVGASDPNGVFAGIKDFKAVLEKNIRAEILKSTPRPMAGEAPKIDYAKQIEEAQASGNQVEVAKLLRLQTEAQYNNN